MLFTAHRLITIFDAAHDPAFIIIVLYYFYRTISNEFCIVVIDIYQVKYKIFIQDSSFLDKNVIIG